MIGSPMKIDWSGEVLSAQPRIRLTRSFDQSSHTYLGYTLRVRGKLADEEAREFVVAIGKAAHEKHQFRIGDHVLGRGEFVLDPRAETADVYKVSALKLLVRNDRTSQPPPFHGVPPRLEVYRERGHRRLAAKTFATRCNTCTWGCEMAVELIIDHWNPSKMRYRRESFCYGPKSCRFYAAGPTRKVPGRRGMSWEEKDWIDEDATAHRGPDD